jgi:tRNA-dihydrouridine synthase
VEIDPEDRPLSGQLAGGDSEDMARAASILVDAGFDAVDLNFACPAKKNKLRPRAGRLLADAPRAIEILRAVRDVVPPRVALTVKMRKAFDDGEEAREGFFRIFEEAWDAGCDAVTVHGRTVEQAYFGRSDAEFLRRLKADHPARTILGSGDVFTARDAVTLLRVTGVDGVSIARGAIGNPWIFEAARRIFHGLEELPPPTVHEQREAIREHYALAVEAYGEAYAGRRLRKIAIRYGALHPQAAEVKRAFIAVACPVDWGRAIDRWYTHDAPGAWPPIEAVNTAREAAQGDEDPGARDDDAARADGGARTDDLARADDTARSGISSSVDTEGGGRQFPERPV